MSTQLLADWPHWRNRLIARLRTREVSDDRIGDILLEADAHLRDTGENPDEAFGDPADYADALIGAKTSTTASFDNEMLQAVVFTGITIAGVVMLASGAQGLGQGTDAVGSLESWFSLPAGVAVLLAIVWWLPPEEVRNPFTGLPLLGRSVSRLRAIAIALIAVVALVFYLFGRLLA